MVLTKDGLTRGTTLYRIAEADRWDPKGIPDLKGLPWNPVPKDREELQEPLQIPLPVMDGPVPEPIAMTSAPKSLYVKPKGVEAFGLTTGCQGCEALIQGKAAQTHTETCRAIIQAELQKTEAGITRISVAAKRKGVPVESDRLVEARPDPEEDMEAEEATGAPVGTTTRKHEEETEPETQTKARNMEHGDPTSAASAGEGDRSSVKRSAASSVASAGASAQIEPKCQETG